MGREIESCRGICGLIIKEKKLKKPRFFLTSGKARCFVLKTLLTKQLKAKQIKEVFFSYFCSLPLFMLCRQFASPALGKLSTDVENT
jgi:hypothetical protein